MPSYEIAKDDICLTNLSKPGGLVKIVEVIWDTDNKRHVASVEFLEDHPYGYSKGTKGAYPVDDLIFIRSGSGEEEPGLPYEPPCARCGIDTSNRDDIGEPLCHSCYVELTMTGDEE